MDAIIFSFEIIFIPNLLRLKLFQLAMLQGCLSAQGHKVGGCLIAQVQ